MLSADNQVSEQEMDEVITRSTYQESKEASSSPGLGTVTAHLHSTFRRVSRYVPPGGTPLRTIIGVLVITGLGRSSCQRDSMLSLSGCF